MQIGGLCSSQEMLTRLHRHITPGLISKWRAQRRLGAEALSFLAEQVPVGEDQAGWRKRIHLAFHGSSLSIEALEKAANHGDAEAVSLLSELKMIHGSHSHWSLLDDELFESLASIYWADEAAYLASGQPWFPHELNGRNYGFEMGWIRRTLEESATRFADFRANRSSDVAILVGNGPSLMRKDFSLLEGQDVFISNYAIKHPWLARIARGIAVSNPWVTAQEPYWFNLADCWKFFPFWHANSIQFDESCVFLNAYGGELYFSADVTQRIAWHSTVTYFWLQILYSAGYRKVLLIGVDNSYQQAPQLEEGDLIDQKADDPNHFDPEYFKGKRWQAADTSKMESAYRLAKEHYEKDGREIVDCTRGGRLQIFRRARLAKEIHAPAKHIHRGPGNPTQYLETPDLQLCRIRVENAPSSQTSDVGTGIERHFRILEGMGRQFVAVVGMEAGKDVEVMATISEDGVSLAELLIAPGPSCGDGIRWFSLRHCYESTNGRISIRVEKRAGASSCRIHHILLMESPQSVFNHLPHNSGLLAHGHEMMRQKDWLSAIPLFAYLAKIRPLPMYLDNARIAMRKLGLVGADQDALLKELGMD